MNKFFKFPNGLTLCYSKNDSVRSVSVGVYVRAGCLYENEKNNGVSHFVEHMFFKGTKTRSAFDIVAEVDSLGARINAATSKLFTYYYTISLAEDFDKCLEILSDLYFNSTFPTEEFERERKVILEELAESEDTPDDVCIERAASASLGSHPLAKTILGTKESLTKMTREDLFAYVKERYVACNTVVSVAGDLDFDAVQKAVEKYFASNFEQKEFAEKEILPCPLSEETIVVDKKIEQVHIVEAYEGVDMFDDRECQAIALLTEIFCSSMSSRLFQTIREKLGLCYSIYGYPSFLKTTKGRFYICTSTNAASVSLAVEKIDEEINLLLKDGVTEAELERAKKQAVTSTVLGQESTSAVMRALGRQAILKDELYDIDAELRLIESVTCDEVVAVAKKVFGGLRRTVCFVGDTSDKNLKKIAKTVKH